VKDIEAAVKAAMKENDGIVEIHEVASRLEARFPDVSKRFLVDLVLWETMDRGGIISWSTRPENIVL